MAATNLIAPSKPVRISRVWVDRSSFSQLVGEGLGSNERTRISIECGAFCKAPKFLALSCSSIYNTKVEVGSLATRISRAIDFTLREINLEKTGRPRTGIKVAPSVAKPQSRLGITNEHSFICCRCMLKQTRPSVDQFSSM
jgi:hypothetical protein